MNRTLESLMIWGSLGVGVGLLASGHKKAGWAIISIAPATVSIRHPRATVRTLRAIPQALQASGRTMAASGQAGGKAIWRSAEVIAKGIVVASKIANSAA